MDKNVYKSDKNLENRGWQAMQELLDREMPVEDRRRRPLWLFWLFGLMLCLTTTYVVWQAWPSESDQPTAEAATPIAGLSDQSGSDTKLSDRQQQSNQAPFTSQNITSSNTSAIQIDRPREGIVRTIPQHQQAPVQWNNDPIAENSSPETAALPKTSASVAMVQTEAPSQPLTEKSVGNKTSANAVIEANQIEYDQQAALPELPNGLQPVVQMASEFPPLTGIPEPVVPASSDTIANVDEQPPIEPVKPNLLKPWSFGATVGLLTGSDFNYTGTNLGLSVEWQPARRWGLRGSLLYQFQKLQKEQRSILEVSSGSYVLLTGDQTALDPGGSIVVSNPMQNSNLVTPVYVPVSRLHRLEIPVNFFWHPLRKWRVVGGLSMGLNLYAQSGQQTLKNNLVLNVPSGEANRNLNQEITKQLPDWDLRWNVGIGFKPNRHLAFELYMHNPFKLLPQNGNADYLKLSDQGAAFESYGRQVATSRTTIGDQTLFQISASAFF